MPVAGAVAPLLPMLQWSMVLLLLPPAAAVNKVMVPLAIVVLALLTTRYCNVFVLASLMNCKAGPVPVLETVRNWEVPLPPGRPSMVRLLKPFRLINCEALLPDTVTVDATPLAGL